VTPAPGGPRAARARAPARGRRVGLIALLTVAALATAAGSVLIAQRLGVGAPADRAELGGLTTTLKQAGWVPMEAHHMDQTGFQMPAQMMPGAPTGDDMRLGIPVTLVNTSDEPRGFSLPGEFTLSGGRTSSPVRLHSDTVGRLRRLNPGSAVSGVLYFDTVVPDATDPPLVLRWSRDGEAVDLLVPMADGSPAGPAAPAPHQTHG
jgi:hypothetical protein